MSFKIGERFKSLGDWNLDGNAGTVPGTDFIGTTDATDLVFKTGGVERARFDHFNAEAGGPAFDLRPGDAMILPDFILARNTMRIVTNESAFGTTWTFEANNDTDASIRQYLFQTRDTGTFGSYIFQLGNAVGSVDNRLTIMGDTFDFIFNQQSLNRAMHWDVNDGGTPTRMLTIDANDSVTGLPKTTFPLGHVAFADDVNYVSGLGALEVTPLIDDIPGGNPEAFGVNIVPTMEWTAGLSSVFAGINGSNMRVSARPSSGLGAGTDTATVRALSMVAAFNGNGTGRTLTSLQGLTAQAQVQDGTVTDLVAIQSQGGTILAGATATSAISIRANAPFEFLGGSIGTGISFVSVGGTAATTNFNAAFTGATVPSYFEGPLMLGSTAAATLPLEVTGSSSITGNLELDGNFNHDGTNIGLYGAAPIAQSTGWSNSNVTVNKTLNANSVTLHQLADYVGTLTNHLLSRGDLAA